MPAVNKDGSNLVTENVTLSNNPLIDALIGGNKWGGVAGTGATIYYSFPTSGHATYWSKPYSEAFFGFSALNSSQQVAASSALQSWANVANISIQRVTETASAVGDIRFGFTSDPFNMASDTYAYAFYPTAGTPKGGDIWLNPNPPATGANYNVGAKGYQTLLHEVGHALGLDHSFVDIDNPLDIGLPYQYEQYQYSMMSYSDTADTFDNGYSGFYPTTPMLMDIQAIQYLYGANMTYHTGNDTYVFNGTTKYYQTIWDAGGNDTIQYVSSTGGLIDLNAGSFSQIGAPFLVALGTTLHYDNVAIAYNVTIENAIGGNGNDRLIGNGANNILNGGLGADTLLGGAGNDTYIIDNRLDIVNEELNTDTDDTVKFGVNASTIIQSTLTLGIVNADAVTLSSAVFASPDLTQIEHLMITGTGLYNIIGNAANNALTGNAANNSIIGGLGKDTLNGGLGNDNMDGGDGDDIYFVDAALDIVTEATADSITGGIDEVRSNVTRTLGANLEKLILTGAAIINATGNELNNIITGNSVANSIDGGVGADAMSGGKGADTYIVDDIGDTVAEDFTIDLGGGIDTVKSSASTFTLGGNIDNLTLTGTAAQGIGNELKNVIIGNASNNTLDGGAGNDNMDGSAGNDTYIVDSTLDILTESLTFALGGGIDTVETSVTRALGFNFDNLTLTGLANINGTGNTLANTIIGNAGHNNLDGGAGIDVLQGGAGDDSYTVDLLTTGVGVTVISSLQDTITENVGEGIDTLSMRGTALLTNASTFSLIGTNLEHLNASATGSTKLNLVGNDAANKLTGNAAANSIIGGNGNDTLIGGLGLDTLIGGAGDDIYFVNSLAEINLTDEAALGGTDTLNVGFTHTLSEHFENLNLLTVSVDPLTLALNNINATGNAADNSLTGNGGNNILNGMAGADAMNGGKGADTYIIDDLGDTVTEDFTTLLGGIDIVRSSVSFTLGANVENLTLTGIETINGTGNALNNIIIGNASNNTLNGGLGNDNMNGGAGDDTYIVDSALDVLTESLTILQSGGTDTVVSSVTRTLGANFDHLTLTGIANINGTGNTLANTIIGNAGHNSLDGGAGIDTLQGGAGHDTYLVDIRATTTGAAPALIILTGAELQDSIVESNGTTDGIDTLKLRGTVAISLASTATTILLTGSLASIENLDASLTTTTRLNLTGNDVANKLTGNAANNSITGGLGNDTLNAGLGLDTLNGGDGDDVYIIDTLTDVIQDTSGIDTLQSSITVSLDNPTYLDQLENLTLTGISIINGTGNENNNVIIGNNVANMLNGLEGDDSLNGGLGNDTLNGGIGADTLNGGAGSDSMNGGAGADLYIVDSSLDVLTESLTLALGGGIDTVQSSVTRTLGLNFDNLTLVGIANINGSGNDIDNVMTGNDGNNSLAGGLGNDMLIGGLGIDTLIGGGGLDSLVGGAGNDSYFVDNLGDVILENNDEGIDKVTVGVSGYTLNENVENLTLNTIEGTATGNALNNVLTGSIFDDTFYGLAGNDTLQGGSGGDSLYGGAGDDTYYVDTYYATIPSWSDQVVENANEGIDTIYANLTSSTYLLADNVENLSITSLINIEVTANNSDNYIAVTNQTVKYTIGGSGGNDTIIGAARDDMLFGDAGNDTIVGRAGMDSIVGGLGLDTLVGGTGEDNFYFNVAVTAGNEDVITDFSSYSVNTFFYDNLYLDVDIFRSLALGWLNYSNFVSASTAGAAAQDANDYIIYNTDTGNLYYDADGSGAGVQELFVSFADQISLTSSDFYVY